MTSEQAPTLSILTAEQLRRTMELLPEDLPEVDEPTDHPAVVQSVYGDAAAMDDEQFAEFMKARGIRKRILPT